MVLTILGDVVRYTLRQRVQQGRGGRGNIYTWAAGNNGDRMLVHCYYHADVMICQVNENANYDGFSNNRFAIAVGAVDANGVKASYSELGASIFITAPSGGSGGSPEITTDDTTAAGYAAGDCTNNFSGTSGTTTPSVLAFQY